MSRPELEAMMQQAHQCHAQGRLKEAEALCDQALSVDPGFTQAKVVKGNLAMLRGETERAIALFREAVAGENRFPGALLALAVGLRDTKQTGEALAVSQRLVEQFPSFGPGYQARGLALYDSVRFEEALGAFRTAVELKPDLNLSRFQIGATLQAMGRRNEAMAAFREAIRLNPEAVNAMANLGQMLLNNGDPQEALEIGRRLAKGWPQFGPGRLLLGQALTELGQYEEAEAEIRKAIELHPNEPQGTTALAFLLIDQGRTEEAKICLQESVAVQPRQGGGYYYLSQLKKTEESDLPLIEKLETMLSGGGLPPMELEYLNFALGKSYDDLGQWGEAMRHYEEGHRISHARAMADNQYNRDADTREKRRIIEILDERFLEKHRGVGLDTDMPIFICGMIRSGTTLMEQIVSSHPQVGAAGELPFWSRNWWTALDRHAARLDPEKLRGLAEEFLEVLRTAAPGKPRVTDKMPGNVLALGQIHLALPNARILHMQRHPVDTCLSIITTHFSKAPEFACTREDLVFQYRLYLEVVDHWRKVLPADRFMDVRYEQLIEEPETMTRRILDFLGLPWDEACLHHDKNKRSVKTPSVWKVRQPLYKSSIERWRRYEPWLGELAQLLPPATVHE